MLSILLCLCIYFIIVFCLPFQLFINGRKTIAQVSEKDKVNRIKFSHLLIIVMSMTFYYYWH